MNDFIVLTLGHACTGHRFQNEDISSPFVRLCYVKSGTAVFHLKDRDLHFSPGHLYMIPSYTPHSYECEPGFDFYYLFIFQKEQNKMGNFDLYDFVHEVKADEVAYMIFEHYCTLFPQLNLPSQDLDAFLNHRSYQDYVGEYLQMKPYEQLQLHGMVEILLSYFIRNAQPKAVISDSRIASVIDYVQNHIDQTITVEQLSDIACLTTSHLIRAFRQSMGVTPLQYVIRKKIQHAQTLLLGSKMSVQDVGQAIGFDDTSYFIRLFKKNLGFTPQEYRIKLIG